MSWQQLSFAQKQRLAYIDFKLLFIGHVTRSEVVNYFGQGLSSASRDITLYKELRPQNMEYDSREKRYYQTPEFTPLVEHDAKKTLAKLANHISDGLDAIGDIDFPVEAPSQLNIPNIFIVARLIQATVNKKAISITYTSLSSGSGAREVVPHNIVDNGLRWHVRAFDRKSSSFRDFVITRISKVSLINAKVNQGEDKLHDYQWMRMMPLRLVPHPENIKHPTAIELDYSMNDGMLELNVRAAMAGYLLRRWNVDCTANASLRGAEYQLWLKNRQTLYGAENLTIAPGYEPDNEN
ncbi:WYL domain-containing protein [Alteromonas halophila]|uniref:WYL domain-containing protein n=1 Tax=Alteromonas halophila TaxID=516698 RepID=A0A918JD71_9ALTE|nr:WYL domain-containing protein [Alteromonas halophila]GGW75513.1 WYL domain-containing protein [Alteromonas halophila]